MSSRSWIEIDEARLAANYRVVREVAGADTDVLAVVKANAYGHGLEQCTVALARAGAKWLGVGDVAEGVRALRALESAGVSRDAVNVLLMCGLTQEEAGAIAEHKLTTVVWTSEQVGWLADAMRSQLNGQPLRVHIEVETGMSRQGARPGADLDALLRAVRAAGLHLDGVMTHFHSAEIAGSEKTRAQRTRFEAAVAQVYAAGFAPQWIHAGSSSTVDVHEQPQWLETLARSMGARAMVRSGIALYGYCLPIAHEGPAAFAPRIQPKLKPVMTWKTRVLDVREVVTGETVGYDATFMAPQPIRVALLPVGSADGLRRELSGSNERPGGWVMVRGGDGAARCAPIIGRVSMNLTTVDVTGIEGLRAGDEVVLLGDGVTADDHARIAGTIPYEILCGVRV